MKTLITLAAIFVLPLLTRGADSNDTIPAGSKVTFVATADGIPAPTFTWFKDGAAISGATTETLVIVSLAPADAGRYTVKATNVAGSAESAGAVLAVAVAPSVPVIKVTFEVSKLTVQVPKGTKVIETNPAKK